MAEKTKIDQKITARSVLGFFVYLFLNPIILFICAWTLKWGMAWIHFVISIVLSIGSRLVANRKNPDLLVERASAQDAEDVKTWDRSLVAISAVYGPIMTMVVIGLDYRFGWTDVIPLWAQASALVVAVLGFLFSTWAMIENRFFSALVRIQTDRGHTVCDSGPYRIVRHPGYAGGLAWYLMTPLILNSMWAFIPTIISLIAIVIRTALEDRALREELPGYQEFTQKTRFRLLPGIW